MNVFRKYRELRQMSLGDVCDKLNYSRRTIEAIESNQINFMESPYNYYCVKNYSKLLGYKISKEEISKYK
tara:strand:- start:921 stop:1130 length:210 start_codon:yes stop_codon:yes gene_type:complete